MRRSGGDQIPKCQALVAGLTAVGVQARSVLPAGSEGLHTKRGGKWEPSLPMHRQCQMCPSISWNSKEWETMKAFSSLSWPQFALSDDHKKLVCEIHCLGFLQEFTYRVMSTWYVSVLNFCDENNLRNRTEGT